jgi:hypothetical protein
MCELEDALKVIQSDTDLLDRAERRDLPTAHQELIVRSRIEEALGKRTPKELDDTATTRCRFYASPFWPNFSTVLAVFC